MTVQAWEFRQGGKVGHLGIDAFPTMAAAETEFLTMAPVEAIQEYTVRLVDVPVLQPDMPLAE